MLNVLISLVCEGFSEVHSRKLQETRIERASYLIQLEATYLPGTTDVWPEGPTFHLTLYPRWLVRLARQELVTGGGEGSAQKESPFVITKAEVGSAEEVPPQDGTAQLRADIGEVKEALKQMKEDMRTVIETAHQMKQVAKEHKLREEEVAKGHKLREEEVAKGHKLREQGPMQVPAIGAQHVYDYH